MRCPLGDPGLPEIPGDSLNNGGDSLLIQL